MPVSTFKLWKSAMPTACKDHWSGQPVFMGKMEGETFSDAVQNYVNELPESSRPLYTQVDGKWFFAMECLICETWQEGEEYCLSKSIPRIIG